MSIAKSLRMVKGYIGELIEKLSGAQKRRAAAKIAILYDEPGGQRFATEASGMSRNTIRKGMQELESGELIEDQFSARGRKKSTVKLPKLGEHITEIFDSQSQADPKFQTSRLYTNVSIPELRKQLMKQYGYKEEELPCVRTLGNIANELKFTVKTVKKTKPAKKIEETDAIFEKLGELHQAAATDSETIRLSIDTKDRVKLGEYSRGGKTRANVKALDHDFGDEYVTPFGIMDVKEKTVDISLSETKVTADFMVDRLDEYWIAHGYSGGQKKLLINADNGPENSSSRTQFIKRMIQFSIDHNTEVTLAYYPPYHSKYNPIERVWGVLEQHWNGALLNDKETVVRYVQSMTYANHNPDVRLIDTKYQTGVRVPDCEMDIYKIALDRVSGLEKWFVRIVPSKCMETLAFTPCFY